mgnify:CR=1 FL=1
MLSMTKVRIPEITSLETAIRLYYEKIELGNTEIKELFRVASGKKVLTLKQIAKERMEQKEVAQWNALRVNTKTAYEAWGLDIDDLERRYNKLQKLGLKKEASQCPN